MGFSATFCSPTTHQSLNVVRVLNIPLSCRRLFSQHLVVRAPLASDAFDCKNMLTQGIQRLDLPLFSRRQPDCIKYTILRIPTNVTNIAAINRKAIALCKGAIQLPHPIHARRIIITRLHFLLLVHLQSLRCSKLLAQDLVTSKTPGPHGWLLNLECWKTSGCWLWLDHVLRIGLAGLVGLIGVWIRHLWWVHGGWRIDRHTRNLEEAVSYCSIRRGC
jgi:hypothetical protein